MIYRNFLYFIIALAIFLTAPAESNKILPFFIDIIVIFILMLLFSYYTKNSYISLKRKYIEGEIHTGLFKPGYLKMTDILMVKALIVFSLEIYLFDLKVIINSVFRFGEITFIADMIIFTVLILHFTIIWYWGYKLAGEIIYLSDGLKKHIFNNIKFNTAIIIPWMILTLGTDILRLFNVSWITDKSNSPFFQVILLGIFLVFFLIIGPVLIIKLWDCKPLEEGEIKDEINKFVKKNGVKFKGIFSWDSFGKNLMTAGVLGYFPFSRYLLITPELMKLLSMEEIIGVVSHEIGHVKRRHVLYYLLLFIGFAILSDVVMSVFGIVVLSSPLGISMLTENITLLGINPFYLMTGIVSIVMFIVYFRFIFGYFMRNFEREADIYCLESGTDPLPLISSFEKLSSGIREKKGSNWHHFSIRERIDFLEKCVNNPAEVIRHRNKVKSKIWIYVVVILAVLATSVNPKIKALGSGMEKGMMIRVLKKSIEKSPLDHRLYSAIATLNHEMGKWSEAKYYYDRSLSIKYEQPEVLNNLAWLLITCKDESQREKKRGLKLAKDAVILKAKAHILDTLAEAYLLNEKYEEAVKASKAAFDMANGDISYFEKQLKKMVKYLKISQSTFQL